MVFLNEEYYILVYWYVLFVIFIKDMMIFSSVRVDVEQTRIPCSPLILSRRSLRSLDLGIIYRIKWYQNNPGGTYAHAHRYYGTRYQVHTY